MRQSVSWPVALLAVGALLLVLAAVFYRSGRAGASQGRISPGFQQMSPQEQQEALIAAENARRRRGGQPPAPRP
jgi:hypothetical protein